MASTAAADPIARQGLNYLNSVWASCSFESSSNTELLPRDFAGWDKFKAGSKVVFAANFELEMRTDSHFVQCLAVSSDSDAPEEGSGQATKSASSKTNWFG